MVIERWLQRVKRWLDEESKKCVRCGQPGHISDPEHAECLAEWAMR